MELRDYIQAAMDKNSWTAEALADAVGIKGNLMRDAKRHAKGIPNFACVKLAEMLDVPAIEVIAACELVTERREVWRPLVQKASPVKTAKDAIAKATNAPAETKTAPVREPFSDDLVAEQGTEPASAIRAR